MIWNSNGKQKPQRIGVVNCAENISNMLFKGNNKIIIAAPKGIYTIEDEFLLGFQVHKSVQDEYKITSSNIAFFKKDEKMKKQGCFVVGINHHELAIC